MSWERKRIELKDAEAKRSHGYSDGGLDATNTGCCLLMVLEWFTCCWWPVLAVGLTVILLSCRLQ